MELAEWPRNMTELSIHNLSITTLILDLHNVKDNVNGDFNRVIVMNIPNVVCFKYIRLIAEGHRLPAMNSLVQVRIIVSQFDEQPDVNRGRAVANLLQAISNAEALYLAIEQIETLVPVPVFEFHKLVTLEICNLCPDWQGTWLMKFFCCVPNL
ncbi:hypothetical protein V6N13_048027 [Hibiscus sabdariffa]